MGPAFERTFHIFFFLLLRFSKSLILGLTNPINPPSPILAGGYSVASRSGTHQNRSFGDWGTCKEPTVASHTSSNLGRALGNQDGRQRKPGSFQQRQECNNLPPLDAWDTTYVSWNGGPHGAPFHKIGWNNTRMGSGINLILASHQRTARIENSLSVQAPIPGLQIYRPTATRKIYVVLPGPTPPPPPPHKKEGLLRHAAEEGSGATPVLLHNLDTRLDGNEIRGIISGPRGGSLCLMLPLLHGLPHEREEGSV